MIQYEVTSNLTPKPPFFLEKGNMQNLNLQFHLSQDSLQSSTQQKS